MLKKVTLLYISTNLCYKMLHRNTGFKRGTLNFMTQVQRSYAISLYRTKEELPLSVYVS